ncbi:SAM-dependent methyltransferase [Plantactinospora veratri]
MSQGHDSTGVGQRPGIDTTVAHNARIWDYWLGGKDNYKIDREVGDHIRKMVPHIDAVARADRRFLARSVRFLADEAGVRQFLDIGTGLPTANNTHEVAQAIDPQSRIVYVDNDPLVLVHARALLAGRPEGVTDYIEADARDPDLILNRAAETLDFDRPIAVMLLGILNFIQDDDQAQAIVNRLLEAVPSGSYLALTHPTTELGGEGNVEAMAYYNAHATPQICARSAAQLERLVEGLELIEPGLVSCAVWRVDEEEAEPVPQYGVVGRKP